MDIRIIRQHIDHIIFHPSGNSQTFQQNAWMNLPQIPESNVTEQGMPAPETPKSSLPLRISVPLQRYGQDSNVSN